MGIFNNETEPTTQTGTLNLGMTGAPSFGAQPFFQQQQQQQPNMFGQQNTFGAQGGMGASFAQGMGVPNQPIQPPSEIEILIALMNANVPVERWLSGSNFQNVVSMLSSLMALTMMRLFKSAKFVADDDGNLSLDITSLPSDMQTISIENVTMDLQKVQGAAQQSVQESTMMQQQIATIAQQSLMQSALGAAMSDPGMVSKVSGGIGSFARGMMTGGR